MIALAGSKIVLPPPPVLVHQVLCRMTSTSSHVHRPSGCDALGVLLGITALSLVCAIHEAVAMAAGVDRGIRLPFTPQAKLFQGDLNSILIASEAGTEL